MEPEPPEQRMEKYFYTGMVVYHGSAGQGRVVNVDGDRVMVNFIKAGVRTFSARDAAAELSETPFADSEDGDDMDIDELKQALREVLREEGTIGTVEIAEKWNGGEILIKPAKQELQAKSVPIDTFFHKIVLIRNQLRVLEQNINSSSGLTDAEKVDLQQYITRCYGSLTTFNVLFADKTDWFVGSKKD